MRHFRFALMLAFASLPASQVLAHGSHVHTMGTIQAIDAQHVQVRTADGKDVTIQLTDQTKYIKGKASAKASDAMVGQRVVVDSKEEKGGLVAEEMRIGVANGSTPEKPRQ